MKAVFVLVGFPNDITMYLFFSLAIYKQSISSGRFLERVCVPRFSIGYMLYIQRARRLVEHSFKIHKDLIRWSMPRGYEEIEQRRKKRSAGHYFTLGRHGKFFIDWFSLEESTLLICEKKGTLGPRIAAIEITGYDGFKRDAESGAAARGGNEGRGVRTVVDSGLCGDAAENSLPPPASFTNCVCDWYTTTQSASPVSVTAATCNLPVEVTLT